jgi:hypothetical protein
MTLLSEQNIEAISEFDRALCSKANKSSVLELEKRFYEEFVKSYDFGQLRSQLLKSDGERTIDM